MTRSLRVLAEAIVAGTAGGSLLNPLTWGDPLLALGWLTALALACAAIWIEVRP